MLVFMVQLSGQTAPNIEIAAGVEIEESMHACMSGQPHGGCIAAPAHGCGAGGRIELLHPLQQSDAAAAGILNVGDKHGWIQSANGMDAGVGISERNIPAMIVQQAG